MPIKSADQWKGEAEQIEKASASISEAIKMTAESLTMDSFQRQRLIELAEDIKAGRVLVLDQGSGDNQLQARVVWQILSQNKDLKYSAVRAEMKDLIEALGGRTNVQLGMMYGNLRQG